MHEKLPYDPGAYELTAPAPITREEELGRRARYEKCRKELDVYYYRIGYTLAFPLPLRDMPMDLPAAIPGIPNYPWGIWMSWELRERWYTLYAAWRGQGDEPSGLLLQQELAALDTWHTFAELPPADLCTGHLAACLADLLKNRADWDGNRYDRAVRAANRLIDRNIRPWFEKTWQSKTTLKPQDLHNIPCIILFGAALLARTIAHPLAPVFDEKARTVLDTWCTERLSPTPYTEGTAYDGFFLDAATQWVAGHPEKDLLIRECRDAFVTAADAWLYLTLPGRSDLHAPLADTEPEMPFWMNAAALFADWYGGDIQWLLSHISPSRMPARLLGGIFDPLRLPETAPKPSRNADALVSAVVLRDGWEPGDCMVAASCTRIEHGHLHYDNGSLVIGRDGRFFITDPGYQQYRQDEERLFTIGRDAHNCPVIDTTAQTRRRACTTELSEDGGLQTVCLRLTDCYENIPGLLDVFRRFWLVSGERPAVVVCDTIRMNRDRTEISYAWHGGTNLAWAFSDGMARLSNEKYALWIAAGGEIITADALTRHAGSRGPLTLLYKTFVTRNNPHIWWVFAFDDCGERDFPALVWDESALTLSLPSGGMRIRLEAQE